MNSNLLLYVMTGAVVVSTIAILMQFLLMYQLVRAVKGMDTKLQELVGRVDPLLDKAMVTLDESRKQIADVAAQASEVLEMGRKQLTTIDFVLSDVSARSKQQLDRAELVLDDAMARFQETVALLHGGFVKPIREINGLVAGFRAGLSQFLRGGRPTVAQATQDDEMFI
jgi:hypothetical protein